MAADNKHSFAVMAYMDAPFVEETIQSVISQKQKSAVYMTTSTPSERIDRIAEKYNIPLHINMGKTGIVADWEFALSCAKTPYVTLADQDDIYDPGFAFAAVRMLDSKSDSLIAFTNYYEIDYEGHTRKMNLTLMAKNILLWPYLFCHSLKGGFRKMILNFGNPICSPSVTYNLKNLRTTHLFDEQYSMALDWDAWLRMTNMRGSFCYSKKRLLRHRIHTETQTSGGIAGGKRYEEDLRIYRRIWPSWCAKFFARVYSGSYRTNK